MNNEITEYLMHYCKNWGKKGCHPDVSKHRHAKEIKPGEEIPIWPVGKEQEKLDEICKTCELLDLQPK